MDDHYRMIEQDIESLLDENQEVDTLPIKTNPEKISTDNFLSYKNLEVAAKEGPILGQYIKWSTVESDELNVSNRSVEQRNDTIAPVVPALMNNWTTVEMVNNLLLNILNAQIRQNMTKKTCSFCKKNGMNS